MPNYYGCPCEACGSPMTLSEEIVVCPECGAPYHRTCYEKLGRCVHTHAHGTGYEWKFPYSEKELRTCPSCGLTTLRSEKECRCCGATLPPERLFHADEWKERHTKAAENRESRMPELENTLTDEVAKEYAYTIYDTAFGQEGLMEGISRTEWETYIGPNALSYLVTYGQMQKRHGKVSMCFSALLFGPFYFFYRKAWKPAFAFLAAELLLALPTFLNMMVISESTLAPAINAAALTRLSSICSILGFALTIFRTLYAKWLYRKCAAKNIRRIQSEFPNEEQRRAVLQAQGGVSLAAVFGAMLLLVAVSSVLSLLMGSNTQALLSALYG